MIVDTETIELVVLTIGIVNYADLCDDQVSFCNELQTISLSNSNSLFYHCAILLTMHYRDHWHFR